MQHFLKGPQLTCTYCKPEMYTNCVCFACIYGPRSCLDKSALLKQSALPLMLCV